MPTLSKAPPLLMLLLLNLNLTGCATNSPLVVQPARIPAPPPELMEPEDQSVTYSKACATHIVRLASEADRLEGRS